MSLPEALPIVETGGEPARPRAGVIGLGVSLPDVVVGNEHVGAGIGVDGAWIERRTGIRHRRHAPADLSLTELAVASASAALLDAGVSGAELDLVLLATVSQATPMPNLAPQVASAVGAAGAGAFDLGAACSGFVAGLSVAASFVEAGRASLVLLVAADTLSRQVDPHDKRTAALFGDGAGAVVLRGAADGGVSAIVLGSDGSAAQLIANDPHSGFIQMDGHATFLAAVTRMEEATLAALDRDELELDDVDLFVFHQANARITKSLTERLGLPSEKVVDCIAELGNTSAASIPLALEYARRDGRLGDGSRVLVCAVGSGLIWGAALLRWGRTLIVDGGLAA